MRMPYESLEDFNTRVAAPAEPPSPVLLYPTGDIEVLEPLAHAESFVKTEAVADSAFVNPAIPHRVSWFHRSLALAGALAMTAVILGAGLMIGFYGPSAEPVSPIEVAGDQQPADILTPQEELDESDLLSVAESPLAFAEPFAIRKAARAKRRATPRVFRSTYRPRPVVPRPRFIVSEFVPTTLIIYIENGEIKTRIEPQLTAAYKRSLPPGN
jgi:hypothetical protein